MPSTWIKRIHQIWQAVNTLWHCRNAAVGPQDQINTLRQTWARGELRKSRARAGQLTSTAASDAGYGRFQASGRVWCAR